MKKFYPLLALFFFFLTVHRANAYSLINFTPSNLDGFLSYAPAHQTMRVVLKCYQGRNFTGATKIKNLELATNEGSKTYYYYDDRDCLSLKIIGLGVRISGAGTNFLTTGDYLFQHAFSIGVGQRSEAVGGTSTYGDPADGGTITQLVNHQEPPTIITNTNNIPNRVSATYWLTTGFPSQLDCRPIGWNVDQVTENQADIHPETSGETITNDVRSINFDIGGLCYNRYDMSPFTNNTLAFWYGDINDTGNSLLDIASSQYWSLTIAKGAMLVLPESNLTDQEQTQLLRNIYTAIQNNGTAGVITAINNQTTQEQNIANQQEQSAQQRQDEIMDDDTTQAESDMADYMTNFDAGEDQTLSSVITAPIRFAQALSSTTCSPLVLPLPFVNENLTLPCGRALMQQNFPQVLALWDVVTMGLLAYYLSLHIYKIMQSAKDPDNAGNVQMMEL